MRLLFTSIVMLFFTIFLPVYGSIKVVAAENFYGNLAKTIGGKYVSVLSILSNPDADPHLFSISFSTIKEISNANIIIYNGLNYDPWMKQIIQSQNVKKTTKVINVGSLMNGKNGDNPHIWYRPETFPTLAKNLANVYIKIDPKHQTYFKHQLSLFLQKYQAVLNKINQLKKITENLPVTATEPIFGYMASALKMQMKGLSVQWIFMNDTTPSAKMMANYLDLFIKHKVKLLFYNNQVTDPATQMIKRLAEKNHIAVIGVSEMMPIDQSITQWLISILNQIHTKVTYENK